jgi:predicted nucleotide-binding protein
MDAHYPEGVLYDVDDATRRQFWEGLAHDGYALSDGFFVSLTELPNQTPRGKIVNTPAAPMAPTRTDRVMASGSKPKVFIVHGRDDATKNDVARFIAQLELDAVILHEQTNRGRTLTTKFVEVASEAAFAVVLITPDDVGGLSKDALKPRARQNVIFELGYFIGLLGPDKVCALVSGDVERPSDFEAVVYVSYGASTGWRAELARELRAAGIRFDAGKVF